MEVFSLLFLESQLLSVLVPLSFSLKTASALVIRQSLCVVCSCVHICLWVCMYISFVCVRVCKHAGCVWNMCKCVSLQVLMSVLVEVHTCSFVHMCANEHVCVYMA